MEIITVQKLAIRASEVRNLKFIQERLVALTKKKDDLISKVEKLKRVIASKVPLKEACSIVSRLSHLPSTRRRSKREGKEDIFLSVDNRILVEVKRTFRL